MALLTSLLSLAALPCSVPQDEPASLVRWYDARALVTSQPQSGVGVDMRHHVSASSLSALEPDFYDLQHLEEPFSLAEEGVDSILDDLLSDHEASELAFVDQRQGFIRLEGSPAAHEEARRILDDLRAFALESVDVEVVRLPRGLWAAGDRTLLDRGEAEALLGAAGPLPRARTAARIGHTTHVGNTAIVGSLVDYDVEVAQGSLATDPQVSILRPGQEVGLRVRRAVGGGLLLEAWGRDGTLDEPLRQQALGAYGEAQLEMARMRTRLWTSSGALEDGGALVVGCSALRPESEGSAIGTEDGALLIRVRDPRPVDGAKFLPLGELVARPMFIRPPYLEKASPSGGWMPPDRDFETLGALLDASDVVDVLEDMRSDEDLAGRMFAFGDRVYLPDVGPLRQRAHETARELAEAMASRSFEVDLRWDLLPATEVGARADATAADWAELLGARSAGVVRSGDTFLMSSGAETRYLADYDVEIAQAATIGDPIQSVVFEGASLWCQPAWAGEGRVAAWVELEVHAPVELRSAAVARWEAHPRATLDEKPLLHGEFKSDAEIQIATTRRAAARVQHSAADGEWGLVALTPVSNSDRYLVAVLKVTSR